MTNQSRVRNRIYRDCSCGNTLSIPPNKRGEHVFCLECGSRLVALEPETLETLEEKRSRGLERHIQSISLWLAVSGLIMGIVGVFFLLKKDITVTVSPVLETKGGGALMMIMAGFLFWLAPNVANHRDWSRTITLVVLSALTVLIVAGMAMNYLQITVVSVGILVWNALVIGLLYPEETGELFTDDYRELMTADPPSLLHSLGSFLFWIPVVIAVLEIFIR